MVDTFAFDQESIVYGCIKDYADDSGSGLRHEANREAILTLCLAILESGYVFHAAGISYG